MRYYRKVIQITADDSPNVKLALEQKRLGLPITHERLVPGVLTYADYLVRHATWNPVRKCIGLAARFYKGGEILLFPPDNLIWAEKWARALDGKKRVARALGIDPGEGGDPTAWSVVDEYGLIYLESRQTPDTNIIPGYTIELIKRFNIPSERVCFDRGGGGKEHADRLRAKGYRVRSVGFGESIMPDPKAMRLPAHERRISKEERGSYKNRRAQMYGEGASLFDHQVDRGLAFLPSVTHLGCPADVFLKLRGFALPTKGSSIEETLFLQELNRQLSLIPRWTDEEGKMYLPRKQAKGEERYQQLFSGGGEGKKVPTLNSIIGRSPDEADSLVLAIHAMLHKGSMSMAGAF